LLFVWRQFGRKNGRSGGAGVRGIRRREEPRAGLGLADFVKPIFG
jgi:hypothetical protein